MKRRGFFGAMVGLALGKAAPRALYWGGRFESYPLARVAKLQLNALYGKFGGR